MESENKDTANIPLTEERLASAMMFGATTLAKSAMRNGQSGSEFFLKGVSMLPEAEKEMQGSHGRHSIVDTAAAIDKETQQGVLNKISRLLGRETEHPQIDLEVQAIQSQPRSTDFTTAALEADLLMAAGKPDEAKAAYKRALQNVRASGAQVME